MKPATLCILITTLVLLGATNADHAQDNAAPTPQLVVHAAGYISPTGTLEREGIIVIGDGTILRVGGEIPANVRVDTFPTGAVVCPGLVDCQAALGVWSGLSERADAIQPAVRASDAFNPYSPELRRARNAGVTTFAIVPSDEDLVGGRIAVCQTSGPNDEPHLLQPAGPLKLSISPACFKVDRPPTSRMGALGMLRTTLEQARLRSADADPLAALAHGQLVGFLAAPSGADVLSAVDLAREFDLQLVVQHSEDARQVASAGTGVFAGVIVGPLTLDTNLREAFAPARFATHNIPVAIAGGLPATSPDALRIGAAIAARAGLPPAQARLAITTIPAQLLGVGTRVGTLKKDLQADLVVFSGDPLDLRTRVLAVYVAGQRVYSAEPRANEETMP